MKVDNFFNVYGRGWVLIVYGEELTHTEVRCDSVIARGDTTFTIKGVERTKYDDGWWSNRVGLVLSPNGLVPSCFEIGQEIEILPKKK